ncbi:hypothetical protein BDC45DRAFT_533185 [Circinella umbellata]|nr:hypothetical protein BDC45DRAFT_533185 [Circinella umbellata]
MTYSQPEDLLLKFQNGTARRQNFLDLMPYDLIAAIFSFLYSHELFVCISVCQSWRTFIIQNPHILWKAMLFHNTEEFFKCPVFSGAFKGNQETHHIRSLSLDHSVVRGSYQNIKEIEMADMFKHLIKTNCSYIDHLEFLQYLGFAGEKLRWVDIGNSYIDPRLIVIILNACPNLISLRCVGCTPYVSSILPNQLISSDASFLTLVDMEIVIDETIEPEYLKQLLQRCTQLKSLVLKSQVDWIVSDTLDRPPPEVIFDAIYDTVQKACNNLEEFTFSCLPYWTVSEYAHITHQSPVALQDLFSLTAKKTASFRDKDNHSFMQELQVLQSGTATLEENKTVKRKYATLEYYVGCPPPRIKNPSWTILFISVDVDITGAGYQFFPFTLGSVRKFLNDRPDLTTVEISGILEKRNYRPYEILISAVTGLRSLRHLVLQDTTASILTRHKCPTLTNLTIKSLQCAATDNTWLNELSLLFQNTICKLEVHLVRPNFQGYSECPQTVFRKTAT